MPRSYYTHWSRFCFLRFNRGINFLIRGISTSLMYRVNRFLIRFALDLLRFKCRAPGLLNLIRRSLRGPTIFTLFSSPLWCPILYFRFLVFTRFFQLEEAFFVRVLACPGILGALNSLARPKG